MAGQIRLGHSLRYDIQPLDCPRPINRWLNNSIGPPIGANLRVRRRPRHEPFVSEKSTTGFGGEGGDLLITGVEVESVSLRSARPGVVPAMRTKSAEVRALC